MNGYQLPDIVHVMRDNCEDFRIFRGVCDWQFKSPVCWPGDIMGGTPNRDLLIEGS